MFEESNSIIKQINKNSKRPLFYFSYDNFYNGCMTSENKINDRLKDLQAEFDSKGTILQNLSNQRNEKRNLVINWIMLIIAVVTLAFVIFPDKANDLADVLTEFWDYLFSFFRDAIGEINTIWAEIIVH